MFGTVIVTTVGPPSELSTLGLPSKVLRRRRMPAGPPWSRSGWAPPWPSSVTRSLTVSDVSLRFTRRLAALACFTALVNTSAIASRAPTQGTRRAGPETVYSGWSSGRRGCGHPPLNGGVYPVVGRHPHG